MVFPDSLSILDNFDMTIDRGLVFTESRISTDIREVLIVDQAKKIGASAVYFRRQPEVNKSTPQIYIFENIYDEIKIIEIHKKLWSSGSVPLFFIINETELKIFSSTQPAKIRNEKISVKPIDTFEIVNDILKEYNFQKYSAILFDNGTFWEKESNKALLDIKNTPYQILLNGLIRTRKQLELQKSEIGISDETISKLLITGVLVKYLEEKEDYLGNKLLEIYRDFYDEFPDSNQFTDILRNGQCVLFFERLSQKFNGKVFNLTENEKREVSSAHLNYLANFFDSTIGANGEHTISFINWKLYSFNYLPIELISGIYEAFLNNKRSDIVYTPPFLVNFLIDECMPLNKANEFFESEIFRVLDPACGSGIFLVSALKRMIQWKAIINFQQTGKVEFPDIETIKRIIRNNIFGVDIENEATLITIFSLSIALCDKLTPMQIWDDLKFDDLSKKNIQKKNFFQYYNEVEKESFDLVIGNPPFNPPKKVKNSAYFYSLLTEFDITPNFSIHDQNLALLFWDKASELIRLEGEICLVLPSGTWLYNENAHDYRTNYLENKQVDKIFDFTQLSDVLFHGSANVAVCAVKAKNQIPDEKKLIHITVKRTNSSEKRAYFELDHYDFHHIDYSTAKNNPLIWKSNLFGGKRLFRLLRRLRSLRTLETFLKEKRKDGWQFGEGFIIGHDGKKTSFELEKRKFKKASWITNKDFVLTEYFDEKGIHKIEKIQEDYFYRSALKQKLIFSPPHILIKENLGDMKIPMVFSDNYLCFKDKIIGIYSPNRDELITLFQNLDQFSQIYRFYTISTSSQAGITFSNKVLLKSDIMNLPYPEYFEDLVLNDSEKIVLEDVMEYIDESKASQNQLIKVENISEFGKIFCKVLNPIYEKEDMFWQIDGMAEIGESLTVVVFKYGLKNDISIVNLNSFTYKKLENLVFDNNKFSSRITRVFRSYLHINGYDILILVKPNFKRYWSKSIALRDADETFADLKLAGF